MQSCSKELIWKDSREQIRPPGQKGLLRKQPGAGPEPYLENFKAGNVQDAQEGRALPLGFVEGFVHPGQDPAEEAFVCCFGQGLYRKVSLRGKTSHEARAAGLSFSGVQTSKAPGLKARELSWPPHLLLGLCLLNDISSDLDPWGEDGPGEICHVDALEVANLLGSWNQETSP